MSGEGPLRESENPERDKVQARMSDNHFPLFKGLSHGRCIILALCDS